MSDSLLEENESLFRSFTYKKEQLLKNPKSVFLTLVIKQAA